MKKLILSAAFLSGLAFAHAGAEGVVKDRMNAMKAIGDANRPLVGIARGRAEFDIDVVQSSAQEIAKHAGSSFAELFPQGSDGGVSEALPTIWTNWEKFEGLSLELERAALDLALISSEEEFSTLYQAVTTTCRSCHTDFRE